MWSKGHELKYWNKTGIKKGSKIYSNYYNCFELDRYDFVNKRTIDIGCGPFGGVGSLLGDNVVLVDFCADEYNSMKLINKTILFADLNSTLPFPEYSFDFAICTNAIDHINKVSHGFSEIHRVLKEGGIAFVHVHLRKKSELNKAHIHSLSIKDIDKIVEDAGFSIVKAKEDTDWVNDNTERMAAYLTLNKPEPIR